MMLRARTGLIAFFAYVGSWLPVSYAGPEQPILVEIDASQAPLHVLHIKETIVLPQQQRTLVFSKWLPGEHGPTGPLNDLVDLHFESKGKPVAWQRDPLDLYAFHLQLPNTTNEVVARFRYVTGAAGRGSPSPASASAKVLVVKGNQVLLYPQNGKAADVRVRAAVTLPPGWNLATALGTLTSAGPKTTFASTTLETFIDSPILAGAHSKLWDLTPAGGPTHRLFAAADSEEALLIKAETLAGYRKLVLETGALFGARPYRHYTFLVALSDRIAHGGLEHHESSDNRVFEDTFIDESRLLFRSALLPHEMAHAWNGKLRRPTGLVTANYQQPYDTSLLWVYEGLTSFLGEVLAARAGLRTADEARDMLAITAAGMDATSGRAWRSLGDTATSAQVYAPTLRAWRSSRRGLDYYPEMYLVWLQVDALIRQLTNDSKSLDDFCKAFYGITTGKPAVLPYDRLDVVKALNNVVPFDWEKFFRGKIDSVVPRASDEALQALGWKLVWKDEPSKSFRAIEAASKETNLMFSLGVAVSEEGLVADVVGGSPAALAGVAPAMQIVAINGRRFSTAKLRSAVQATVKRGAVELIVENGDFFSTKKIVWRQGNRYPSLQREASRPDRLSALFKPLQN